MEIRRSYDRLISTIGFPILVRCHLYIELGPRIFHANKVSNMPVDALAPCIAISSAVMGLLSKVGSFFQNAKSYYFSAKKNSR